jgi:hypothetical protein
LFDSISLSFAYVSLENLAIVQSTSFKSEAAALMELIGARAYALQSKVHILEEIIDKVD